MYEHGIDVVYDVVVGTDDGREAGWWSEHRRITLPGWCAGDVQVALALHLFGHSTMVESVRVIDWQPRECVCRQSPAALLSAWLDGDREAGESLLSALALDPARVCRAVS